MLKKVLSLAALLAVVGTGVAGAADMPMKAAKPVTPAPFFFVNENTVGYSYQFTATNPGAGVTPKHVLNFTHFDVWAYGTNFFTVDWLKATNGTATPTAACGFPTFASTSCSGYTEVYGFFRSTLGFNEVFGTKAFSMGPLTNVSLMVGADLNTDNTALGSAKRSIETGIQFSFATPYKGFLNLTPTIYKEWQNDSIAAFLGTNPSGNVDFKATWGFEWLYVQPLAFLPSWLPLTFKAFGTIHGKKGAGEPGAADRTVEYFAQENLELDVGKVLGTRPGMYSAFVGYRYWKNKFGIDPVPSGLGFTVESTWITGFNVAF